MVDPGNTTWVVYAALPVMGVTIAAGVLVWLRATVWDRRDARAFFWLIAIGSGWGLAALGEVATNSKTVAVQFNRLQFVLAMATLLVFVVFVSFYTERGYHHNRAMQGAIVGVLVLSVGLALTDPWHSLLSVERVWVTEPFPHLATEYGLGYLVALVVVIGLIGYSWITLVLHMLETPWQSGLQLFLILLGGAMVAVMAIAGELGLLPASGLNHAVYGTLPFLLFASVALFRLGLFEGQPIARSTVVERLRDPIVILDSEGHLVDHNLASETVWPEIPSAVGAPLESLCAELASVVSGPDEVRGDRLELLVDGENRHFSVTATAISYQDSDETGWFAVVLRDVTEMERSREQLQVQNQRLDQVASTVSHDLRNPIQIAEGYADFLGAGLEDSVSDPEAREQLSAHLEEIETSLERMQDIIDDVLTLAREGTTVEETDTLSLEAVAGEAWENVDTGEATLTVTGDRPIEADRSRLLTIFENLYRNAVEHAGDAPTVTVSPTTAGFAVADDGPGIPPEHRENAFSYGYTTAETGTGFGLSIVQSMAESHGWSVTLDDSDEKGARFEFIVMTSPGALPVPYDAVLTD